MLPTFSIENVTPEMAQNYLGSSPYNRVSNNSMRIVQTYAAAMERGEWKLNGESLIFDEDNRLLDGHHRLLAVTMAGVPVAFSICRGVNREAFTTYNCGLRTNLGQILGMKGEKNCNLLQGILGLNYNLEHTGRIRANNGAATGSTRTVTSDFLLYQKDKADYDEAAEVACRLYSVGRVIKQSWIGGVYYFLTHFGQYNSSQVLPFFEALCRLETSGITAADTLRNFIIRRRLSNMKIEDSYLAALLIKSWNAYIRGREVRSIRYNPEIEEYPKFILNR